MTVPASCPSCESPDLISEPEVDDEGLPTGRDLVACSICGWQLGELEPPSPAPEAELEPLPETSQLGEDK